jgi:hypothetical protein
MNRISFNQEDASHLYELAYQNFQEGCYLCDKNKKRLESFIGTRISKSIRNTLKKNPY